MSQSQEVQVYESFDVLGLREELLRGIYAYGFEKPSAIQQRAIKPMIDGVDVIAQAQSGTGKTGTFVIGSCQTINVDLVQCQVIILAPTRELAQQIQKVAVAVSEYMKIKVHACVGGTNVREDVQILKDGVHMVVGTPGRVYDMLSRRALNVTHVTRLVLDEADQMLDRGFKEQIYEIFRTGFNPALRVAVFSATLPDEALELVDKFMQNPVQILVKKEELTLDGIRQFVVELEHDNQKIEALADIYSSMSITQSIMYCNSRRRVDELARALEERSFTVSVSHGEMGQHERELVMKDFRAGITRILITTDLLARGIDIQQVSLVINFDLPNNRESYIHRIGRSGRFGRKGVAINLVSPRDKPVMKEIEEFYKTVVAPLPVDFANILH